MLSIQPPHSSAPRISLPAPNFLSLLHPPISPSPHTLPGSGPGGRVNHSHTAGISALPGPLPPRRWLRPRHTHRDPLSSGRPCQQLPCAASSSTQGELCHPLPGPPSRVCPSVCWLLCNVICRLSLDDGAVGGGVHYILYSVFIQHLPRTKYAQCRGGRKGGEQ